VKIQISFRGLGHIFQRGNLIVFWKVRFFFPVPMFESHLPTATIVIPNTYYILKMINSV
jgi:hypothetical protein